MVCNVVGGGRRAEVLGWAGLGWVRDAVEIYRLVPSDGWCRRSKGVGNFSSSSFCFGLLKKSERSPVRQKRERREKERQRRQHMRIRKVPESGGMNVCTYACMYCSLLPTEAGFEKKEKQHRIHTSVHCPEAGQ